MLSARDSTAAEFAHLLAIAVPLVRRTVQRRFATARHTTNEDLEDVCADAVSSILVRLRRQQEGGPEILDFESYAATVASHTADRFFAARAPQRARLRNRIRYVLTTDRRFSLREPESGVWLCALSRPVKVRKRTPAQRLPDLVESLLAESPGPLELSELTTLAAQALGVTDRTESVEDHADLLRDPAASFAHTAELRNWLLRLWTEIVQLPLLQRIALLFHMGSNSAGGATLCTVADLGIASFAELATNLGMSEAELARLWNRVPLADREIAAHLNMERQQVINLRASARQRLTRRMNAIDEAAGANKEEHSGTGKENR